MAHGFNEELQDELEKDFVKRKRFKVFALSKKAIWKVNSMVKPLEAWLSVNPSEKSMLGG